jgi:hypothetical protein
VTEANISKFHEVGWLPGDLVCSPISLDFSMMDRTNIVCFESHLMCCLSLPPSKFLVAILGYLGYELIHLNLNVIAALSYSCMMCKCWLGIPPNATHFWYFYSLVCYH